MHKYLVNASIQIIPVIPGNRHPYEWVDEAIDIIRQSGIKYKVAPFSTELEGSYEEVSKLIDAVNEYLYSKGLNEWITQVQIQIRS
ncbi:MAG: hypothetical protein RLZZ28_2648, partial [Bacteroidota bacterium]